MSDFGANLFDEVPRTRRGSRPSAERTSGLPPARHTQFHSHRAAHATVPPRERPERTARRTEPAPGAHVAVLVDLDALVADVRSHNAEVSMHRLRAGLAGPRPVSRAVAIAKNPRTPPAGFELAQAPPGFAAGVHFAATAIELVRTGALLVMAPASEPVQRLALALRAAGHSVELAGFDATGPSCRALGRECLFVP